MSIFETAHFRPTHNVGRIRGFVLVIVAALHFSAAIWLLQPIIPAAKKQPKVIEIVMLPKAKTIIEPIKEPPPAPVVKKEPIKPVIKPQPTLVKPVTVKKVTPQKIITQPKVVTTVAENTELSIPKYESTPIPQAVEIPIAANPPVTKSIAKPTETSGHGKEEAISGGNCENCSSIENRLKRRYARRNFAGSISFLIAVDVSGKVQRISVKNVEPTDVFDEDTQNEIKESLMEMEFEPKTVNGKAISFDGTKTIRFQH